MFLRILLLALLAWLGYRFFKGSVKKQPKEDVQGKPKSKPLDLGEDDVAEAKFEDIEEK